MCYLLKLVCVITVQMGLSKLLKMYYLVDFFFLLKVVKMQLEKSCIVRKGK